MAGPALASLSSNWKELQKTLKSDPKEEAPSNAVKRKRPAPATAHPFKETRLSDSSNSEKLGKRRKMGGYLSPPSTATKASKLIDDHDIDPSAAAAAAAAYGPRASSDGIRRASDDINGGLHKTHKLGKYVALDCEMVGTGPPPHADNLLARASLVNFHNEQIYDSYVQPPPGLRVEDYRTHVSGIKPHHMKAPYARPFAEVQREVSKLLDGRILVGHALKNDLQSLMLTHPKRDLRDTARHPQYRIESKGKPPALRNLTESELGIEIQTGEHSSIEDARAAMMLFQKDKDGFEAENRKHFGQKRPLGKAGGKAKSPSPEDDSAVEEEDEDEHDLDLLDGEDGDGLEASVTGDALGGGAARKKKSKKKKKRTKRK
ncbi:RNA exonuclease 4 [Fulvia fulva]|uniref:RNA exonuclease 4 n=1 Tax=Passalora fulva TaxID=5499 RepID=A0A9Q8USC6_PASFU|nr:RNA exonuclease 4 [Fulvia fulva]KAK4617923.1 RNA exonuclease 4 [Fulvia fulva]KAK4618750.1 RNA exonuclease 4 [Fulvia fulva]UJO20648.1 RNA exonuclease 4 [Fulvia fulva]WPV18692.1 RNA exonuclease 4 [Fulvia fulva]WPV33532.1 RNA exonuclease 4 [Fulvia fulva]